MSDHVPLGHIRRNLAALTCTWTHNLNMLVMHTRVLNLRGMTFLCLGACLLVREL
jgi:hypothetical protein